MLVVCGIKGNIFVPQSLQTQVELEEIAAVERQLIDPGNSKTVLGIVQDGLLGSYNLTSPTIRIDWRNAMNIMSYTSLEDFSHIKKDKDYSGSELFSLIIPSGINLSKGSLKIKNGQILQGRLSKPSLGAKNKNNLIQLIWDAYGVEETRKFIDNTQRLVNNFNLWNGFSVGIADTQLPTSVHEEIEKLFQNKELKVEHIITNMENNPELMKQELYEFQLFSELNIIREDVSKLIMSNLTAENSFKIMEASGSKGNPTNSGQMCGCIGLQVFEGKLMPKKYNGRTLVYYHQHDDRGQSRGLVKQSHIKGVEFPQYVFMLMASRLGVIEGAIKTAETGYAQRKLIKSMEDIMVKYDNTVRSANNGMIQFVYGDSGTDTTKQYEYTVKMIETNNQEIESKHKFTSQELKNYKGFSDSDNERLFKEILSMRDLIRMVLRKAKIEYIVLTNTFMIPVNLNRIIDTIAGTTMKSMKSNDVVLSPQYIIQSLENLLSNAMTGIICMSESERNDPESFKSKDEKMHKTVFRTVLYDSLSPKIVLLEKQLNKSQFDAIIEEISASFNRNMVEPGEMAGIIAAQSTGEPLTQMTLNSIHSSGISTLSSTIGGVPRIKELLSTSKKPKTPAMYIYFTEEYTQSKDMAYKIASHIKYTTLGEVRGNINVYYDPFPNAKGSIMEKDNIKQVFHHNKGSRTGCQSDINGLPWLMRIELNREKMLEKNVVLIDIVSKFCSWWEKRFSENKQMKKEEKKVLNKITQMAVLSNTDNDKYPVVHIRFNVKDADKDKDRFDLSTIDNFIDHIIDIFKLKGINGISDILGINEERAIVFNPTTGDVEKKTQYVVYAAGVNLLDIRYLNGIDLTKTISNHVIEMYTIFGIEIARAVLLREISNAYEKSGGEVNYHHVSMIVDQMTASGQINSIDRHGMNKSDNDPLSRASFEKTVEQLLIAAVYAETDNMKGVSSRIMAGSVIEGGTGYCSLELDTDMIEKSEYLESSEQTKKFTELNKGTLANDIINKKEKKNIFIPE